MQWNLQLPIGSDLWRWWRDAGCLSIWSQIIYISQLFIIWSSLPAPRGTPVNHHLDWTTAQSVLKVLWNFIALELGCLALSFKVMAVGKCWLWCAAFSREWRGGSFAFCRDDLVIRAGSEAGALLVDGFGDGILLEAEDQDFEFLRTTAFGMLQGCRMRNTKTVGIWSLLCTF